MSATNLPERRPSPLLSNNPFRNRATSPNALPSPSSPNFKPSMTSTNPFLDSADQGQSKEPVNGETSPAKPALTGSAAELFENLTLNDDKKDKPLPQSNGLGRRPENIPPNSRRMPPPGHRPSRSRDEDDRRRRGPQSRGGKSGDLIDVFADPSADRKHRERRPRRNSDTSVMDRSSKSMETDEERRRRHKERERRRHGSRSRHTSSKHKVPTHRLDVIDKLDVTSIFGTGTFHHDGPFDACNPNRNRKGLRTAPMMAFPKDSVNMALGGAGPVNKDIDHNQFHGIGVDAYNDFSTSGAAAEPDLARPQFDRKDGLFNPNPAAEYVHGAESEGLGTSTFLEGAPASRAAIAKLEEEQEAMQAAMNAGAAGGLGRKKSLAQRIRGISNSRPNGPRVTSPEPSYSLQRQRTMSPTTPGVASGPSSARPTESNPFFQDYDKEYEKKGVKIADAAEVNGERPRAVSSPKRPSTGLERAITTESIRSPAEASKTGGGGLLSRVKSLKGGPRRTRPERRDMI